MVFRNNRALSMSFFSSMYCRMATGELLNIYVDYMVSKDFVPKKVLIEKKLGQREISEVYQYDESTSSVRYLFISEKEKKQFAIPVSSRFHITTPTTATSMLFLKPQNDSSSGKSDYSILTSYNKWNCDAPPDIKTITVQRDSTGTTGLKIGNETVYAPAYKVYEWTNKGLLPEMPFVEVFMSRHVNIPYMIKADDNLTINMRKLLDLEKD